MNESINWAKIGAIIAVIVFLTSLIITLVYLPYQSHQEKIHYLKTQFPIAQGYEKTQQYDKAIEIYKKCIDKISIKEFPQEYSIIQLFLGIDYGYLAEKENKKENLKNSIFSLNEALSTINSDNYPVEFIGAKSNLGADYVELAEFSNKEENLRKAIDAFNSSLETISKVNALNTPPGRLQIKTFEGSGYVTPFEWVTKEPNLGVSYLSPLAYGMTKESLGVAYKELAFLTNNETYFNISRGLFSEALKSVSKKDNPDEYARIQFNYGSVANGFDNQIYAYNEALSIATPEKDPDFYAKIEHNIGSSYFSENPYNLTNIEESIKAYKLSQNYLDKNNKLDIARNLKSLGDSYTHLGILKNKKENFENAKNSYDTVLTIYMPSDSLYYADTQGSVGFLYTTLGDVKNNLTDRQKAQDAYNEAFNIFRKDTYPNYYNKTDVNYQFFLTLIK